MRCAAGRRSLLKSTNGHVIDVVVGTQRLKMLPMLVEQAAASSFRGSRYQPNGRCDLSARHHRAQDPVKAYVTIIEGCNDHCAFCVVPYTRGHERMRAKADILADVRHAVEHGRREIQLLGQIVNHYQAPDDPDCDFAQLLAEVNEVPGVERIRFASPHPRAHGRAADRNGPGPPEGLQALHLPVQSGSTRVLERNATASHPGGVLELVGRIREAIPEVALSTDMIVGFPGETAADFEQTLSLVRGGRYHSMFSFKYSSGRTRWRRSGCRTT